MSRVGAVVAAWFMLAISSASVDAQSRAEYRSVDTIHVDSLVRERPVATLSELLSGRVSGMYVSQNELLANDGASVGIRAPSSTNSSAWPMIFVDGARYTAAPAPRPTFLVEESRGVPNPLDDLDPNDIATIEVLKGPSATALYGANADNGVLLITTKRGQTGRLRASVHAQRRLAALSTDAFAPSIYRVWGHSSLNSSQQFCTLSDPACVRDSLSIETAFPEYRPSNTVGGWNYGGAVSGGIPAIRYYVAGHIDDIDGFATLAPATPETTMGEQGRTRTNLRANLIAPLGRRGSIDVDAVYIHGSTASSAGSDVAADMRDRVRRILGSASARVQLAPWLAGHATVGTDNGRRSRNMETGLLPDGTVSGLTVVDSARQRFSRADAGLTASLHAGRVTTRSTVGGDYTWEKTTVAASAAQGGGSSFAASTQRYDAKVHGFYLDQMVALNERLFVTGGLRTNSVTVLGTDYRSDVYPQISASWSPFAEPWMPRAPGGVDLRLRYGFGISGSVPNSPYVSLQAIPTSLSVAHGKAHLNRASEHEFGVDAGILGDRLQVKLTRYSRHGDSWYYALPFSGSAIYEIETGLRQHGYEGQVGARVIQGRWVSWSVTAQYASNTTEVEANNGANFLFAEGYPLGTLFRPQITFADANGDGVIASNEIQASGLDYVGSTPPRHWAIAGTTVGLFQHQLRLSALVERRSGSMRQDLLGTELCRESECRAAVDASTPLAQQAEAAAIQASIGYYLAGAADFTRLRELAATLELPSKIAHAFRTRSASLTLAGRNVATWSDANFADPETGGIVPPARAWMLRMDVGM